MSETKYFHICHGTKAHLSVKRDCLKIYLRCGTPFPIACYMLASIEKTSRPLHLYLRGARVDLIRQYNLKSLSKSK